jgi:hypothetical protein
MVICIFKNLCVLNLKVGRRSLKSNINKSQISWTVSNKWSLNQMKDVKIPGPEEQSSFFLNSKVDNPGYFLLP